MSAPPSYSSIDLDEASSEGIEVLYRRTPLGAQYEPDRKEVANFTGNRGPTNNTGLNLRLRTREKLD